jgi:chromosomal replication initiation ATPase DnaA
MVFKNRKRKTVYARTMAIAAIRYYCPECNGWTLARIGLFFDRQHSSICNDLQRHAELMLMDYDNYVENY